MEKVVPLKMLAVLSLVLLGSSVNEGRIVDKCELKAELDAAFGVNMTANMNHNLTGCNTTQDLVAKIVCSVNRTSRFNTSLITTIQISNLEQPNQKPIESNENRSGERHRESNEGHSAERHRESNEGRSGKSHRRAHMVRLGRIRISHPKKPEADEDEVPPSSPSVVHLLGIFQLSDRVACDSGSNQSLNVCRMSCSALTDDDIMDDVECLETLITKISNTTTSAPGSHVLPEKMDFFFAKECHSAISSSYFADCS